MESNHKVKIVFVVKVKDDYEDLLMMGTDFVEKNSEVDKVASLSFLNFIDFVCLSYGVPYDHEIYRLVIFSGADIVLHHIIDLFDVNMGVGHIL